jgi:ATP-dependent exoDNAse (exonuclease V) beta subunit
MDPMSWSRARDRAFKQCPRRARHQHYTSIGGHRRDAAEITKTAFRLKRLTTLSSYLGQEIHARAREIALAVLAGKDLPDLRTLIDRTRGAMNRLYQSSKNLPAFMEAPRAGMMLHEQYYHLPISNDQLLRIRGNIETLTANLLEWPGWAEVAACAAEDVLLLDLAAVSIDDIPVYAVPDLVFRCPEQGWVIVDYKTGSDDGVDMQVALYALYVQRTGLEGPFLGLCVSLGGEPHERIIPIGDTELALAHQHIIESVAAMAQYLEGGDTRANEPLPIQQWPIYPDERACRWCPFFELCEPEINETVGPF